MSSQLDIKETWLKLAQKLGQVSSGVSGTVEAAAELHLAAELTTDELLGLFQRLSKLRNIQEDILRLCETLTWRK